MFNIYSHPNQKLKVEILGNKFNEKISERLTLNDKIKKTKIDKIFYIQDKFPKKIFFDECYNKIISAKNSIHLNKLLKKIVSI